MENLTFSDFRFGISQILRIKIKLDETMEHE